MWGSSQYMEQGDAGEQQAEILAVNTIIVSTLYIYIYNFVNIIKC